MAKKVKGATITFEVTDDGTLKQVSNRAKGAKKGIDGVSKSAGDARRNMQAMSGRTESASKSFSRMQQGTGGLVQSYAILASTLFAITAAFRALEQAQNIQAQIRGFKELTKITGTSMLTITNSVRDATGGLLDFQTAAQQTAIATAAGFSADQITGLAEGAKNASVALGRDLTDSFNRLIRGVTKAEPELLDELGVILRLDIATRNYAASIGASADKLTIAQRRTAVYNEVNKQLNDNFGAIAEKADELVNPVSRFVTKLGDIGIALSETVLPVFTTFISFLERNMPILIGLLVLFARRLIVDIVPGISTVNDKIIQFTDNTEKRIGRLNKSLDKNSKKYKQLANASVSADKKVSQSFKKSLKKRGMEEKTFFSKSAANQKRSISAYINSLKKQEKATGKSMQRQIAIQRAAYKKIEQMSKTTGKKVGIGLSSGLLVAEKGLVRLQLVAVNAFGRIAAGAMALGPIFASLGTIINAAFGVFMALMFVQMFVDMIPAVRKAKEATQELRDVVKDTRMQTLEVGAAMAAFQTTKLQQVADSFKESGDTLSALATALDHLSNTIQNVDLANIGDNIIESVETGLIDGGFTTRKWWSLWLVKQTSDAAKLAGEQFGLEIVSGITTAMMLGPEGVAASKDLLSKLIEGDVRKDIRITQTDQGIVNNNAMKELQAGLGLKNRSVLNEYFGGRGNIDEVAAEDALIEQRVNKIMELISLFNTSEGNAQSQVLTQLNTAMENFGITADNVFQVVQDEATGIKSVTFAIDGLDSSLDNLSESTEETATALLSFKNIDEPLKNLAELRKLTQPKPSETQKTVSGLEQIKLEMDAIGKAGENGTIGVKLLSKELQDQFKDQEMTVDMLDVVRAKIQINLGLSEEQSKVFAENLDTIIATLSAFEEMRSSMAAMQVLQKTEIALASQLNDRHTKKQVLGMKYNNLTKEILLKEGEIADNRLIVSGQSETENKAQEKKHELLVAQREELLAQQEIIRNQLDLTFQLGAALIQTFDSSAGRGLEQLLMGTGDSSEIGKKIAEDLQKATAGVLSDAIMTPITGGLKDLLGFGDMAELTPEAKAIQTVHNKHVKDLQTALNAHVKALGGSVIDGAGTIDPDTLKVKKGTYQDNILGVTDTANPLEAVKESFGIKDFFSNMFSSFTSGFSSMFSGMMGGLGGIGSSIMSIFGLERGGVIGLARGGMMPRYAHGGIAKQPTYLVGEGKQHEAVVPLPDNRSIPVDLGKKGAGNQNNTNITVNMADGSSEMTTDGGAELAKAIDAAVQTTIEKELRPGGILSGG